MEHTCAGGGCKILGFAMFVLWWLVSSGLLYLTWNKVIVYLAKLKAVKYWQALLFVATLVAFVAPMKCMKQGCHRGGSHCLMDGEKKEKCPYAERDGESKEAPEKAN